MRNRTSVLVASMIAWGSATAAMGADLPARVPPLPPAPVVEPEPYGGLYVRVDGGAGFTQAPTLSISPDPVGRPTLSPADPNYRGKYTAATFSRSNLSTSAFGDLGIGYQVSNYFRVDVTGEYRGGMDLTAGSQFVDKGTTTTPFGGLPVRNTANIAFRGQLTSAIGLVNGYADLGTYYGFTPFVGAGIGVARTYSSGLKENGTYSVRVANFPQVSAPLRGYLGNAGETSLAWALMGGLAYDITPGLKLEVGYRYLDFGRMRTGTETFILPNGSLSPQPYAGRGTDLVAHDVKVGLRWSFGVPVATTTAPPLIRRY